jgi:hypothetical protein
MFIFDIIKQSKNNIMEKKKSKFTIFEIVWSALTVFLFFKAMTAKKDKK